MAWYQDGADSSAASVPTFHGKAKAQGPSESLVCLAVTVLSGPTRDLYVIG